VPGAPARIHLIREAAAIVDGEVREALAPAVARLRERFADRVLDTPLRDLDSDGDDGLEGWCRDYCTIQWAEIWSTLGAWIEEARPALGPATAASFELARSLDRGLLADAIARRERRFRRLAERLGPRDLLCVPTVPSPAPRKGSELRRDRTGGGYYARTLALTSIAGLGRLPQVSLPAGEIGRLPVGLSLIAAHGEDAFLLGAVQALAPLLVARVA
jgi:amidase